MKATMKQKRFMMLAEIYLSMIRYPKNTSTQHLATKGRATAMLRTVGQNLGNLFGNFFLLKKAWKYTFITIFLDFLPFLTVTCCFKIFVYFISILLLSSGYNKTKIATSFSAGNCWYQILSQSISLTLLINISTNFSIGKRCKYHFCAHLSKAY